MKATINIEYSKENWDKVHAILWLLETESINYDADFGSHRTIKGEPPRHRYATLDEFHFMGYSAQELADILYALDFERKHNIEMTMSNLKELWAKIVELHKNDMSKVLDLTIKDKLL